MKSVRTIKLRSSEPLLIPVMTILILLKCVCTLKVFRWSTQVECAEVSET